MRKGFIVLMALVLMTAFIVSASYARDYGKGSGKGKCCKSEGDKAGLDEKFFKKAHFILENEEDLGLSDEQIEGIKDLKMKTKKDLIKTDADIELLAIDIKEQLRQDVIDQAAANDLIDKKYELKKAKAKSLVGAYVSLKNILTDDQKKELKGLWRKCGMKKSE